MPNSALKSLRCNSWNTFWHKNECIVKSYHPTQVEFKQAEEKEVKTNEMKQTTMTTIAENIQPYYRKFIIKQINVHYVQRHLNDKSYVAVMPGKQCSHIDLTPPVLLTELLSVKGLKSYLSMTEKVHLRQDKIQAKLKTDNYVGISSVGISV